MATPKTAPTCRTVFCTADPEPERSGGVASVIRVVDGAMVLPRPKPNTTPTTPGTTPGCPGSTKAKHSIPARAKISPTVITVRAPKRAHHHRAARGAEQLADSERQHQQAGLQR